MMEIIKLNATRRLEAGKGPSTRLRREGLIPATAYGRDLAANSIAVSPKDVFSVLSSEHGQNAVVELQLDEGVEKLTVMVRDYSYHPITRALLHTDFVQVKLDMPVDVEVPFRATGKAKGIVAGGILQTVFRKLPVRCLPERIPVAIEADISDLGLGETLHVSQLKLPEGVTVRLPDEQTIAVCAVPEKFVEEEKVAAAAAPGAPAAAPAAAGKAPAAGGKAPAAAAAAPAAGKAAAAKPAAKK